MECSHLWYSGVMAVKQLWVFNKIINYPTCNLFSFLFCFFLFADKSEKQKNHGCGNSTSHYFPEHLREVLEAACPFLKWVTFTFDKTSRADKKAS